MKHFSEFSTTYQYTKINEGTLDIFTGKGDGNNDSKKCTSILQMFKMAFLNVATGKKGGDDENTNLSEREKQQVQFANELAKQAEKALQDELKHEEKLELAYNELAHKQKMAELDAEEARKKYEREKELAAVKATIAKLTEKSNMLKTISGGPSNGALIDNILVQMQEVSKGVLPAEKKLMDNIRGVILSACYDKDGKYIGEGKSIKELVEAKFKDTPEFKEIFAEIQKDPTFKALNKKGALPTTKDEMEKWIDGVVNEGLPTTETMKNAQAVYDELDQELSENRKKKNANEKKIETLQGELKETDEPKLPDAVKSLVDKARKNKKDKKDSDNDVSDEDVKSAGNALVKDLQDKIKAAKAKGEEGNENLEKYLGMLKTITGDDSITVEIPEGGGEPQIKSDNGPDLKLKEDITQKDLEGPIEELTKEYKEYHDKKDEITKLEEENKKITEKSKQAIENANGILKEYDNGITDDEKKFEIQIEDGKIPENVVADKTKANKKAIKKHEDSVAAVHVEAKKAHKDLEQKEKEDDLKQYDEKISQDETFQKELKASLDGTSEDLYGEHAMDPEKDGSILIPTGEVENGEPKYVEITAKELKNPSKETQQKLDRAMYIRQASISDEKINELLDATPTDDSEEAKLECAKKIKMGQELKKAKLHAVGELEKDVTDSNNDPMFKALDSDSLEKFYKAEKDYNPDEEWDDDDTDNADMDDDEKTERKNKIKDSEGMSDEDKEKKAKEDLEKAKNGEINPATVFKGGKDKRTGKALKTMKHVYNDNYRISRKKYKEMVQRYKEKKAEKAKKEKEDDGGQSESLQIKSLRGFILESLR